MEHCGFSDEERLQALDAALKAVGQGVQAHAQEWFCTPLIDMMQQLGRMQRLENAEPICCISVSFLRTSVLLGQPAYRLEAYGADWQLYQRALAVQQVQCPWFVPIWHTLTDFFQKQLAHREIKKYASPLLAEQAACQCLGPVLSMLGSLMKYEVQGLEQSQAYRQLAKGDCFRIEFGELLDWKIIWKATFPPVDLFNSSSRAFPHRSFRQVVLCGKRVKHFNLKGALFQDCEFTDSVFEQTVLNDCVFERCKFNRVTFLQTPLAGARFQECTLEQVTLQEVTACVLGLAPEQINDWYAALYMEKSSLNHVQIRRCDLRGAQLWQCTTVGTMVYDTQTEQSDFEILVQEAQNERA